MKIRKLRTKKFYNIDNRDLTSYTITGLSVLMPMTCKDLVFWIRRGDREERRKENKV